ncbi:MAG: hypothetical protein IJ087_00535 [Eggerthellaceae bacterium]|nr:hypothetical protein [Eggerthellaceae bacterium]
MAWQTPFSEAEDQFIRGSWPDMGPAEIARHLGRSRTGVSHRVTKLGLREGQCPDAPARMGHGRRGADSRPKTMAEAARSGDEQKVLETLRDVLAERIDATTSARDTAALAKRMIEVGARIEEVRDGGKPQGKGAEVTSFDVIASRRAGRRATAQA